MGSLLFGDLLQSGQSAGPAGGYETDRPVIPSAKSEGGRYVIASATTGDDRCDVPAVVNGVALTLEIDTGDPVAIEFPGRYVEKLGLKPGAYREIWPGTRYGKIAKATVREIRVGDAVWRDVDARVYSDWRYTFGDDEIPLLGLAALRSQGIHVEFDGDTCRLTMPDKRAAAR